VEHVARVADHTGRATSVRVHAVSYRAPIGRSVGVCAVKCGTREQPRSPAQAAAVAASHDDVVGDRCARCAG
jgi:hypothetical protein